MHSHLIKIMHTFQLVQPEKADNLLGRRNPILCFMDSCPSCLVKFAKVEMSVWTQRWSLFLPGGRECFTFAWRKQRWVMFKEDLWLLWLLLNAKSAILESGLGACGGSSTPRRGGWCWCPWLFLNYFPIHFGPDFETRSAFVTSVDNLSQRMDGYGNCNMVVVAVAMLLDVSKDFDIISNGAFWSFLLVGLQNCLSTYIVSNSSWIYDLKR